MADWTKRSSVFTPGSTSLTIETRNPFDFSTDRTASPEPRRAKPRPRAALDAIDEGTESFRLYGTSASRRTLYSRVVSLEQSLEPNSPMMRIPTVGHEEHEVNV
ncbi:hypothetical protein Vi05172_g6347 [Venturia inaequalis]|nr:hypothetical protein Vi05172_g6347 [Venturia inaequalis]